MVRPLIGPTRSRLHTSWVLSWRHASSLTSLRPSSLVTSQLRHQDPQQMEVGVPQYRPYPIVPRAAVDLRAFPTVVDCKHATTVDDLDSLVSGDGALLALKPAQLIAWLERRSELVIRDGRPDLRAPPVSVLRVGETLLRLLTSAEHRADFTSEVLSRSFYYLMEPYSIWELNPVSARLESAMFEAVVARTRELGLRPFTPADLGRLMVPLGSTVRRDDKYTQPANAFLDEIRDECLRRGLQSFRAASLGQMLYGFGKAGYEPGLEFRQACVERAGKRGFLSRDCTPPDVSFLLWGHWRSRLPLSEALIEGLTKLCKQTSFVENLQSRHLCCLLGSLSSDITKPRPDDLICHLLDVMRHRAERDGPHVLHTAAVGFAARAASRVGRSGGPAATATATAFLHTMLSDVLHSGPATYLGGTLGTLLESSWDLNLPQSRDPAFVDRLLEEVLSQGVRGWNRSSLCFFLRRVEAEHHSASPHVMGQLIDAALQRQGLKLDLVRPLLDTLRGLDHPGLDSVKIGMWAHVRRVWDTQHRQAPDHHNVTPQTLVYVLRGLAGASLVGHVEAALCGELCEALVRSGLGALCPKHRVVSMAAMLQLTRKGGAAEHRQAEERLHESMWAMWVAEEEAVGAEAAFDPLFDGDEGQAELSILLSGLPLGVLRDRSGALTVLSLAREVFARHCVSSLRPDAMQGLLVGIVQAHSLLLNGGEAVAPIGGRWRLLPELLGEMVRHHARRCLIPPRVSGGVSRTASFFTTIRSPPFLHALLHLYTAHVGMDSLSLVELGDLLEFLGRCAPRCEGLAAEFHQLLAHALLAHDPAHMDMASLYRLMWSLTLLPTLLPSDNYARRLLSACEERGLGATTGAQLHTLLEFMYKTRLRVTPGFMREVGTACSQLPSEDSEREERRKARIFRLMRLLRKPYVRRTQGAQEPADSDSAADPKCTLHI